MSAFTEANRKAFNDLSAEYDTKPWQHKIANQVAEALQSRKDWLGARLIDPAKPIPSPETPEVRLLDYACGTGSITRALGPYVHTIRGVDLSDNMVVAYNTAATKSGLTPQQARAVVGDFCGEEQPAAGSELQGAEFHDFDIAVIGLGFHHFEDTTRALRRLRDRVKPATGVVVIVDFLPSDTPQHGHHHHGQEFPEMQHTIKHDGFTKEQLHGMFTAAGLEDFDFAALEEPSVMELASGTVTKTLFVAKGRRAADSN
ncbi:S-adenosyl-L-methionine-dependent methyltransferase [Dissoconium aciculare CBS 342.82]|uniref:S-adenosyl-L-methionine-dependent methyltransferase n=1 Tax=Dissoconium aciculare CBS 342.82 TaxID=1314786 RepID=A0A6J3MKX9_9PEZI|nr:S-adenosyl-L-methionine-dependent methyltransferase [Dissoconium aciculare CBS 342.82]KAF1827647.1 S-adenosyl-L-methionine-dependent methyltransferase [Dissoconium aciculare CBS 342.82]